MRETRHPRAARRTAEHEDFLYTGTAPDGRLRSALLPQCTPSGPDLCGVLLSLAIGGFDERGSRVVAVRSHQFHHPLGQGRGEVDAAVLQDMANGTREFLAGRELQQIA